MRSYKFEIPQVFFFLITVVFLSILGIRELFLSGYFESHDGVIHVMRLAHFDEALKAGQFPVRWLATWMAGYGSPVFNFNWSFPYYVGSIIHGLGFSLQTSIEIIFAAGYILSGLFCFFFLKELLYDSFASLAGSVLYIWAPYRFTDIFIRGALGEATAFIFLPLLFLIAIKTYKSQNKIFPVWSVLIWASFILSHNMIALVGSLLFFLYLVFLSFSIGEKGAFLKSAIVTFSLGVGLSAFFWLPAFWEKNYDMISKLKNIYNYENQFPSFRAIVYSPWKYAYAIPEHQEYSMSFQLGLVHLILPLIALAFIFTKVGDKSNLLFKNTLFFLIIYFLSIFMTNSVAKPIYDLPIVSSIINFPWRFLTISTFASSSVCAILILLVKKFRVVISISIVTISIFIYWPYAKIVSWKLSLSDMDYRQMIKTNINYLPDTEFLPIDASYLKLLEERGPAWQHSFFEDERSSNIFNIDNKDLSHRATIRNDKPTQIRANTFYFPGWQLYVDNKKTSVHKDNYGLISFWVESGEHKINLIFENTPIRTVANTLSIASFVVLVILLIGTGRRLIPVKNSV